MKSLVLAVCPTSRGCGWSLFESPLSVVDWGTLTARRSRQVRILNRIERLLARYQPDILAIRKFGDREAKRWPNTARMQQRIVSLAETHGITVMQYDREAMQLCFKYLGATTRREMAEFIAQHVDALRNRLPRVQKIWNGESPAMSIFDSAALAFTYFAAHGELS